MAREIKFRAWDLELREMFHNVTSLNAETGIYMQYTGLKDKNGVEIYEGDVVGYKWQAIRSELLVVEWSVSDGAYSFGGIRTDYAVKYGEVIGNIYENPGLVTAHSVD